MNKNWRWLLVLTITESVKVPSCMGSHWYFYLISRINISTLYRSFIIFLHTANTQKTNNVYKNYHSISSILENVTLHQYPHNKLTAVVSLINILVVLMIEYLKIIIATVHLNLYKTMDILAHFRPSYLAGFPKRLWLVVQNKSD